MKHEFRQEFMTLKRCFKRKSKAEAMRPFTTKSRKEIESLVKNSFAYCRFCLHFLLGVDIAKLLQHFHFNLIKMLHAPALSLSFNVPSTIWY